MALGQHGAHRATSEAARSSRQGDQFSVDDFWSVIALLGPLGAAGDIEALVRGLAASTEDSILAVYQRLMSLVDALGTPDHASQEVGDVDAFLPATSPAGGDVFLHARVAVVAAGRDVYASVLAEPVKLAGGWPLRSAQLVLNAAPTAFARVTGQSWASHPARALPGRAGPADLVNRKASSDPATVRA